MLQKPLNVGDRVSVIDTEDVGIIYMATLGTDGQDNPIIWYNLVSEFVNFDDEAYTHNELLLVEPVSLDSLREAAGHLEEGEDEEEDDEESDEEEENADQSEGDGEEEDLGGEDKTPYVCDDGKGEDEEEEESDE